MNVRIPSLLVSIVYAFGLVTASPGAVTSASAQTPSPAEDPRVARAAAACTDGVDGVLVRGEETLAQTDVAAAFAALADGDLLWFCPGVHGAERTLVIDGRSDVTLAGAGAVVAAAFNDVVLRVQNARNVRLNGLGFTHDLRWEDCSANVVEVVATEGLDVSDSRFDGSGVIGLYLDEVTAATVAGNLFVNCQTGLVFEPSSVGTVTGNRFAHNVSHVDGALTTESLAGDNTFGPLGRDPVVSEPTPMPAPEATDWPDWSALLAAHPVYPLTDVEGAPYIVVHHTRWPYDGMVMPDCFENEEERCPVEYPYAGEITAWMPAEHRAALRVVTPAGVCTPALGEPMLLDTSGCEPSAAIALAVGGCGDDMAPLAFVGDGLPALTWAPRVEMLGSFAADASLPPGVHDWLAGRLADCVAGDFALPASTSENGVVRWQASLAHETLTTDLAGFQLVYNECATYGERWVRSTLAVGGTVRELVLPQGLTGWTPWAGVLALDGRVAALVGYGATDATLITRAADGTLSESIDAEFWSDNDECHSPPTPVDFYYPCGP